MTVGSAVTVSENNSNNSNNNNSNTVGVRIGDVACGDSHTIVVTADDQSSVYVWGMNKRGQLGVGDTTTRHQPTKIDGLRLAKVFAGGNSSAGVSPQGELFTWGSGSKYRLMQANGDDSHRNVPSEVS